MKVNEFMASGPLKYCSPETRLHNASKEMKKGNCGALPVLDKEKKSDRDNY